MVASLLAKCLYQVIFLSEYFSQLRSWRKIYMVPWQTQFQQTKDLLFLTKSFLHIMKPEAIFGLIWYVKLFVAVNYE